MSDFLDQAKKLIAQKDTDTIARFKVQIDQILGNPVFLASAARQLGTTKPSMKKTLLLAKDLLVKYS